MYVTSHLKKMLKDLLHNVTVEGSVRMCRNLAPYCYRSAGLCRDGASELTLPSHQSIHTLPLCSVHTHPNFWFSKAPRFSLSISTPKFSHPHAPLCPLHVYKHHHCHLSTYIQQFWNNGHGKAPWLPSFWQENWIITVERAPSGFFDSRMPGGQTEAWRGQSRKQEGS